MTIDQINGLSKAEFVAALGRVYEDSTWIAELTWFRRPFESVEDLAKKMNATVEEASRDEQLALLCAHPELGTRLKVSSESGSEQAGAGLDQLTELEYDLLMQFNERYSEKFSFPFIYAVKGSSKKDVLIALQVRLDEDEETEFHQALWEVSRIARFRLETLIEDRRSRNA